MPSALPQGWGMRTPLWHVCFSALASETLLCCCLGLCCAATGLGGAGGGQDGARVAAGGALRHAARGAADAAAGGGRAPPLQRRQRAPVRPSCTPRSHAAILLLTLCLHSCHMLLHMLRMQGRQYDCCLASEHQACTVECRRFSANSKSLSPCVAWNSPQNPDTALPDMHAIYMWFALTVNAQFLTCYALRPAMPPER